MSDLLVFTFYKQAAERRGIELKSMVRRDGELILNAVSKSGKKLKRTLPLDEITMIDPNVDLALAEMAREANEEQGDR